MITLRRSLQYIPSPSKQDTTRGWKTKAADYHRVSQRSMPAPAPVIYNKPPTTSLSTHHIRQSSANLKSRASAIEQQQQQQLGPPPPPARTEEPYYTLPPFRNAAQRRRAYEMTDLDDYDILVTPKRKASRDSSHVVFPSMMESSPIPVVEGEEATGLFRPAVVVARRSHLSESSQLGDRQSSQGHHGVAAV